jgi:predicted HAD superfamily Cof-like phosphohydrolase
MSDQLTMLIEEDRFNEKYKNIAYVIMETICPNWTPAQKGSAMREIVRVLGHMMPLLTDDVRLFHEKFGLDYDGGPRFLPPDLAEFRMKFMQEELDEYKQAGEQNDLEGQFDALIDLAYVLFGTSYLHGFPFAKGWRRVQMANMTKVRVERPEDSKRGSGFDVIKPEGWQPPVLKDLLS